MVEHAPTLTTEQADALIEGMRTKTMFFTNKKKNQYYLLVIEDQKTLDIENFKEQVGVNRIRMASAESLIEKMNLISGVVYPFGLLNNKEKDIKVYVDREIVNEERMSFHRNTNEKTSFISTHDSFSRSYRLYLTNP
ncbi:hypothetical protein STRDD10_00045 [Streptococcus sp. DD10]|nr:YbaK/EbsC family protein [Streptococcus sp. DD10]KXT77195.1 hypothetical protein STRDD10_00045 [Streptococcus sp. DD10]